MMFFDLAVVGGGPAGLATVLAARRHAPHWRVLWCRGARPGFLPAYGGLHPRHRLNVPVERMGLDPVDPTDFLVWLRGSHPQRDAQPGQFVPRNWLGEYLAQRADSLRHWPLLEQRDADLALLAREGGAWRLDIESADGSAADPPRARRVALCLGLPEGQVVPQAPAHWVAEPWAWWRSLDDAPLRLDDADRVLLVGSGLTAVDMVLGLRARGFTGAIRAVSRSGQWSAAHAPTPPLPDEARAALESALRGVVRARDLLRCLRDFSAVHPWRAVVDALRAGTNRYWAALPLAEQARLLRHAFGPWNRHRHRMAADVRATLSADAGLVLERGRIVVDAQSRVWKRHRGVDQALDASLVLDCRGPGFRAALAGDSLLARLVREGVLEAHPLGTGVRPPREPSLAVLGAARFGEAFETLAIPELRQQAVEVVQGWVAAPA